MTELLHDPDADLTSEQFREFYPDSGDLPLSSFSDENLAYRYVTEYKRCVFDDDSHDCVYCKRWDH